jgi:hypothetical protein
MSDTPDDQREPDPLERPDPGTSEPPFIEPPITGAVGAEESAAPGGETHVPGAPPPMPGAPGMMPAPTSNGFAVAALVLGILSLVLFFTIWLPFLLGVLAVIFGALGISRAKAMGGRQKGLAVAGLVCGIAGMLVAVLFIVLIVNVVNNKDVQDVLTSLVQSPPTG